MEYKPGGCIIKFDPGEIALRDSEARLRAILHTAVEGIITIDERGIIESVNPAALKLFGFSQQEMVGRNVGILMPEPYASDHSHYIEMYLRTGKGRIIGIGRETLGQRKDGSIFPMELSVGEVQLAGERFFTGIVRDITERKQLEKEILEISDREQRRIGQDLHDDLCQHLAAIELMSEALGQKLAGGAQEAEARRIAESVQQAIEQTRTLARGLSPLDTQSADLTSALAELASNTAQMFHIRCRFRPERKRPVTAGDAAVSTHLYRIAQEAISNAIRHGGANDVTISLADAGGGEAVLSITDNGSGIAQPKMDHRGMGLRIMKYRAGMIGGTLEVVGAASKGTVVTCRFRPDVSSIP